MKKIVLFVFVSVMLLVSCQRKYKMIELHQIEYDVLLNNYGNNYSWFDHIEGFSRIELFHAILENARSGKFRIEDINGQAISAEQLENILKLHDMESGSVIAFTAQNINGIRFRERWKVHSGTGMVEKEVIAFCPVFFKGHPFIEENPMTEVIPLFWIYPDLEKQSSGQVITIDNIAYDVITDNTLQMIQEPYGTGLPFYFSNIEPLYRSLIIDALIDAGLQKRTKTFDFTFKELSDEELRFIEKKEEVHSYWNERAGQMEDSIHVQTLDRQQILRLKFAEQWSFDKQTLRFTKSVIGVAPSVLSYDVQGDFKGFRFLFWLAFDQETFRKLRLM